MSTVEVSAKINPFEIFQTKSKPKLVQPVSFERIDRNHGFEDASKIIFCNEQGFLNNLSKICTFVWSATTVQWHANTKRISYQEVHSHAL